MRLPPSPPYEGVVGTRGAVREEQAQWAQTFLLRGAHHVVATWQTMEVGEVTWLDEVGLWASIECSSLSFYDWKKIKK